MNKILVNGSCCNPTAYSNIPDNSVDLIVTSPPYKDKDNYSRKLIVDSFSLAFKVLKDDKLCFVNFGHLNEDKERPFRVVKYLKEIGFTFRDTIIWVKPQYTPLPGNNLNNVFEYIFMFTKGNKPDFDRLAIGKEYKDKSNIARYGKGKDLTCAGNVWYFGYDTITKEEQKLHPDRFPKELPTRCIKLAGGENKVKTVLDIFMGSGTTGKAAFDLGINNFIGIEKDSERFKTAVKNLMN